MFNFSNLTIELILGIGLILAMLAWNAWTEKADRAAVLDAARPDARLQLYNNTILTLWLVTLACTALWVVSGSPLRELGLRPGQGWRFWLSWSVVALAAAYMIISLLQVRFSRKARTAMRQQLGQAGDLGLIHPETPREHARFTWLWSATRSGQRSPCIFCAMSRRACCFASAITTNLPMPRRPDATPGKPGRGGPP